MQYVHKLLDALEHGKYQTALLVLTGVITFAVILGGRYLDDTDGHGYNFMGETSAAINRLTQSDQSSASRMAPETGSQPAAAILTATTADASRTASSTGKKPETMATATGKMPKRGNLTGNVEKQPAVTAGDRTLHASRTSDNVLSAARRAGRHAAAGRDTSPAYTPASSEANTESNLTAATAPAPVTEIPGTLNGSDTQPLVDEMWATVNCPYSLPQDSTSDYLATMKEQYGCIYLNYCRMRNDGTDDASCWYGFSHTI